MMNNTFNSTNTQQQNILTSPQHHHVTSNILQTSPAGISYMQQLPQMHLQSPQHLTQFTSPSHHLVQPSPQHVVTTITPGSGQAQNHLYEPRQLHNHFANSNLIDKSLFDGSSLTGAQSNAILLANNFNQQNSQQMTPDHQQRNDSLGNTFNNSIRLMSSAMAAQSSLPHQVFNINNNHLPKELQHLSQMNSLNHIQQQHHVNNQHQAQPMYARQLFPSSSQNAENFFGQTQSINEVLPSSTTSYTSQSFGEVSPQHLDLQAVMSAPQYYMPAETTVPNNQKVLTAFNSNSSVVPSSSLAHEANDVVVPSVSSITSSPLPSSASTVVLDRINICINNHYAESNSSCSNGGICSPANTLSSSSIPAEQPSPIIPAIQHKAPIEALIIDPYASNDSNALVIDEPDSTTTTPHTPPTTPENTSSTQAALAAANVQSPSTTSTTGPLPGEHSFLLQQASEPSSPTFRQKSNIPLNSSSSHNKDFNNDEESEEEEDEEEEEEADIDDEDADDIEEEDDDEEDDHEEHHNNSGSSERQHSKNINEGSSACFHSNLNLQSSQAKEDNHDLLPLTPPSPSPPSLPAQPSFNMGEDVFIKRNDDRFYLGTVIDNTREQYLVRFDDKSEIWCFPGEMRKLGGSSSNGSEDSTKEQSMCVACKRVRKEDIVETCERCGRGYHRKCTAEVSPGSGNYMCKRCAKPMKVRDFMINRKATVCRQLPYHANNLSWDEKHRVNEEQIYCYCGKTGRFDQNMIQCCKCCNWFHTNCLQDMKTEILRGDFFFVFCCTVCNDGKEFMRRLQMNWVDLVHLTLYNLSAMKKHQKYHHLTKDINPFVLKHRNSLPLPKEWLEMSDEIFLQRIKKTLIETKDRFFSGREVKKEYQFFALRNNGPPVPPKIKIKPNDVLCDEFLKKELKLKLHKKSVNNKRGYESLYERSCDNAKKDVYEFKSDEDDNDNDEEEGDSSEDEIPIQQILEKAKKQKMNLSLTLPLNRSQPSCSSSNLGLVKPERSCTSLEKIEMNDENANDAMTSSDVQMKNCNSVRVKEEEQSDNDSSSNENKIRAKEEGSSNRKTDLPKPEKSSRKRKAFTLSKPYREFANAAAAKPFDVSRLCETTSSDENSSSSRNTNLDLIIPPPKNFLGSNNPFRMLTPKKDSVNRNNNSGGGNSSSPAGNIVGNVIKTSIFNTSSMDFGSKLAALKSAGIFPNLSTSNLAKAAGQPRTVRTIKRRLSAKDILIGPNQEVRRRRKKRSSSGHVEVISQTTINPIPTSFFAMYSKDWKQALTTNQQTQQKVSVSSSTAVSSTTSASNSNSISTPSSSPSSPPSTSEQVNSVNCSEAGSGVTSAKAAGRNLRERPSMKSSSDNSRRSSFSSSSSNNNEPSSSSPNVSTDIQDLKSSVNKYFGVINRIESGEKFSIAAKRRLPNGQVQYLLEWGEGSFKPLTLDEEE